MALKTTCPAAIPVDPPGHGPSVVCGVIKLSNVGAHIAGWSRKGQVAALVSGRQDPGTIEKMCCGAGDLPVSRAQSESRPPCSYGDCPVWQAEVEAREAARKGPDALQAHNAVKRPDNPGREEAFEALMAGMRR